MEINIRDWLDIDAAGRIEIDISVYDLGHAVLMVFTHDDETPYEYSLLNVNFNTLDKKDALLLDFESEQDSDNRSFIVTMVADSEHDKNLFKRLISCNQLTDRDASSNYLLFFRILDAIRTTEAIFTHNCAGDKA